MSNIFEDIDKYGLEENQVRKPKVMYYYKEVPKEKQDKINS